jgi:hypothetical protein
MAPLQSEINLILASVTHRLEQLTKPVFDRATVEELLAEIMRLRSADHRRQLAQELAWRDNQIDEQSEQLDERDEEIAQLQETVVLQRGRIDDLQLVNASLSRHLSEALLGTRDAVEPRPGRPNRMPPMELTDDGLAVLQDAVNTVAETIGLPADIVRSVRHVPSDPVSAVTDGSRRSLAVGLVHPSRPGLALVPPRD